MDTDTKTVLHYAKKIREYCQRYKDCVTCPIGVPGKIVISMSCRIYGRR